MTCSICLDEITDLHETNCGHQFCKSCFQESQKYQQNCPVCRSYFEDTLVNFGNEKPKAFKQEDILINNYIYSATLKKPEILAWLNRKRHFSQLYLVKTVKNKTICISSYLRHVMIYHLVDEENLRLYVNKDKISFYCTEQKFHSRFIKEYHYIIEEWIYEVMKILSFKFKFCNFKYLNVLVGDIVMYYIHKNWLTKRSFYQVIICASIFVSMEIYNKTFFKPLKDREFFKAIKATILDLGSNADHISQFEKIVREIKQERYMFEDFLSSEIKIY